MDTTHTQKRLPRSFTPEFKAVGVELCRAGGGSNRRSATCVCAVGGERRLSTMPDNTQSGLDSEVLRACSIVGKDDSVACASATRELTVEGSFQMWHRRVP